MVVDPVTLLMVAGAILQIWSAVHARASAKTPDEIALADAKINESWAAAEALIAPHVAGARERLASLKAGGNPYGTLTPTTMTEAIRASGGLPVVPPLET